MARKTKEEALETRDGILNAAVDVFFKHGFAQSSLEGIAETAGVTRGAVYWHFKNKTDIFAALHDRFHVTVMDALSKQTGADAPALEKLKTFSIDFLNTLEKDESHRKILTVFNLKCDYSGEMAEFVANQSDKKKESLAVLASFFTEAIEKGEIAKDHDSMLLALSYFCYLCGICNEYLRHTALFDTGIRAEDLIAQFFRGVK